MYMLLTYFSSVKLFLCSHKCEGPGADFSPREYVSISTNDIYTFTSIKET